MALSKPKVAAFLAILAPPLLTHPVLLLQLVSPAQPRLPIRTSPSSSPRSRRCRVACGQTSGKVNLGSPALNSGPKGGL